MLLLIALIACTGDDAGPEASPSTTSLPTPTPSSTVSSPSSTTSQGQWVRGTSTTTVAVADPSKAFRTYELATDHEPQRDDGPSERTVTEQVDDPVLRSGSVVQDALFAMAMAEVHEASVAQITDGAFADGAPTPCDCFETGEEWTYVWTRDTAYAAHLALAWIDPERTAASLRYKLAWGKPGSGVAGPFVVQDTGSGGSWPVSTDRVTWALGALETWRQLPEGDPFGAEAAEALANTVRQDHDLVAGDDGLMRGEMSFLDWREQSYPLATASQQTMLADSAALGTNMAHLAALRAAATLAEAVHGDPDSAATFTTWAEALQAAVDTGFWHDDLGGWSSWVGPPLDPGPRRQRDLLGTSLAALALDRPDRAADALASYPHGPLGAPVIWPQQPDVPVYHNRGQWPFVTAYAVWAARRHRLSDVFTRNTLALVDGAALNLSNMENFEWSTQAAWFDDGDLSGPVVNSRRQLWSVAGYLALWLRGIAGLELDDAGLHVDPFLPCDLAATLGLGEQVTLDGLPVAGRRVRLTLALPAPGTELQCDALGLAALTVDGEAATGPVPLAELTDGAELVATLGPIAARAGIAEADVAVAPRPPEPTGLDAGLATTLSFATEADTTVTVFRDGEVVAEGLTGASWVDPVAPDPEHTACYSLAAVDGAGRSSHRSPVQCAWGPGRVQVFDAYDLVVGDGRWATDHGRPHIADWGEPDHTLQLLFRPDTTGAHLLQVVYANGSGPASTGITAGHKRLLIDVEDDAAAFPVADRPVVFPHTGAWDVWQESTAVPVTLDAGVTYRLTLSDLPNMTALDHFTSYTGGLGGGEGVHNAVDVAEVKLLALSGPTVARSEGPVLLDGVDDYEAFPEADRYAVGVPRQPWEGFALAADDDVVSLAWVTEAGEDPVLPAILYLQADPVGDPVPSVGMTYLGQVPSLPFTPTHAITLRSTSDLGDGAGPWSGVWALEAGDWVQRARLDEGHGAWVAADAHTLSAQVPRWLLGDPDHVRIAGHVVNAAPGEEWKTTVPEDHTPWDDGGDFLELELPRP